MKIAAVTDDGKTISPHFGRARQYVVLTVEEGSIIARELRDKPGHRDFAHDGRHGQHNDREDRGHGFGVHSDERHGQMFAPISDCQLVLARGMGQGAHQGLQHLGIRPILTDIKEIDPAVQAVVDGSIEDHPERLH